MASKLGATNYLAKIAEVFGQPPLASICRQALKLDVDLQGALHLVEVDLDNSMVAAISQTSVLAVTHSHENRLAHTRMMNGRFQHITRQDSCKGHQ